MPKKTTPRPALLVALTLLACGSDSSGPTPTPPVVEEDGHEFLYAPPSGAPAVSSLALAGSFNGWTPRAMTRQESGAWRAVIDLPDGRHQYKFVINGEWVTDMCHDPVWGDPAANFLVHAGTDGCMDDGHGGRNAFLTLGDVPLDFLHYPGDPAHVSAAAGRVSIRFRASAGEVTAAGVVVGDDTTAMHRQLTTGWHEVWRATLPEGSGSYRIRVRTPDTTRVFGPFTVPAEPFAAVEWVADAVGYQIFPERFWNGDPANDTLAPATDEIHFLDVPGTDPTLSAWSDAPGPSHCCHQYFGGDLQGIVDRLDHLSGLGVGLLYLNPIFHAGSAHGYDTYDYLQVAPELGDSTVLRALLDAAHARGIRVIWDFVPNHVGVGHWAFQDAVEKGEASDYWDWFRFLVPADSVQVGNGNHYQGWWGGAGSLPELMTSNPDVLEHLLDVARHWTAFGFDGIRVDVPGDIDNRAGFFPAWRDAVKAIDPDAYLVGEIWERDPTWLTGDEFDALMNYAVGEGVVERFARGDIGAATAARGLGDFFAAYPEAAAAMLFNLLASHDTDRLLTKLGGGELGDTPGAGPLARQRLASALLFALPGMPVTFQGDECAFLGGRDGRHTARYPMQWGDCDADMRDHYAALAGLKRSVDALGSPVIREPAADDGVLSFLRGEPGAGEVLALFNNGEAAVAFDLPDGAWTDLATGEPASGSVQVAPLGWRYLRR